MRRFLMMLICNLIVLFFASIPAFILTIIQKPWMWGLFWICLGFFFIVIHIVTEFEAMKGY